MSKPFPSTLPTLLVSSLAAALTAGAVASAPASAQASAPAASAAAPAPKAPAAPAAPSAKTPAPTRSADLLPFKATETTLPNGLKLIVVPTGFPNLVSVHIPVQTGSRNEVEPGKSGFAHFFEHMMFRGTKAYPPEKYKEAIKNSGARQNAYTDDDLTNYYTTFAKEDLETVLKVEADRFQNLSYPEPEFKTEARAVLGEYNKNSANPAGKLYEVTREAAFQKHTYKHTTMGFVKDIEDMPNQFDYSKIFFDRWYRPERTTIIVAGDVDPKAVAAMVEKYWGKWQRGKPQAPVPVEPPATGPVYRHVPWASPTLPLVSFSFHGPAFSVKEKDLAALEMLFSLSYGEASPLYKRLMREEQKVDQLNSFVPQAVDPSLVSVFARVKNPADVLAVRDALLQTAARARVELVGAKELEEAKSSRKYRLMRSLDNTEQIAGTLVRFVHHQRSYATINQYYRLVDSLTPADLQAAARKYLTDANLVVATLSKDPLPPETARLPKLDALANAGPAAASAAASAATSATTSAAAATGAKLPLVVQNSALPQINFKLMFAAGSAHDPKGKEGLAALTAAMVTEAGSEAMKADEIAKALFPMAGSFRAQTDKEVTTFTGNIHKDNWDRFTAITLPQLLTPGFREDDFRRLKDAQKNALLLDLKDNNEEEFGKERLQTNVYTGTGYGHPTLGTVKGLESITLADVRQFWKGAYTQGALRAGVSGDVGGKILPSLQQALAKLPAGPGLPATAVPRGKMPQGLEVEIIEKPTRATALSFGLPMEVTRTHPDFPALWLAKTWLGEHRSGGQLYERIRELRGMNYGDYAYVEAFPGGMFQFFPNPNRGRKAQLFEIWVRPVVPENAHFALRLAITELERLVENGLTQQQFQSARNYLMKNVFVMTATQDQRLGYALDDQWYGTPEFTKMMRDGLAKLDLAQVNAAIKRHFSAKNLSVVFITKDAKGLRDALLADTFSPIKYDAEKPKDVLEEDKVVGARKLGLKPEAVRITPVAQVFAE